MGNLESLNVMSGPPPLGSSLHDLSEKFVRESTLGDGRFMKTFKCLHDDGVVVVKVYLKRSPQESLVTHEIRLKDFRDAFSQINRPNVFPFYRWIETKQAGYLIRQYFLYNLYDRIGTRPFLNLIEKRWIAFQLLHALAQTHRAGICHGDIKCENVLLTSWTWVYLSDFAPFKPAHIPPDGIAEFDFFFDTGGRGTCYLAPERFRNRAEVDPRDLNRVTHAMDIFALGCVIAEMFLEGTPIFTFPQSISYRKGEYDPGPIIDKIEDKHMQEMVRHMIQMDPNDRADAEEYLRGEWGKNEKLPPREKQFPDWFWFLREYIWGLMCVSADDRIRMIREDFRMLLRRFSLEDTQSQTDVTANTKTATPQHSVEGRDQKGGTEKSKKAEPQHPAQDNSNEDTFALLLETEKFIRELEEQAKPAEKKEGTESKDSTENRDDKEEVDAVSLEAANASELPLDNAVVTNFELGVRNPLPEEETSEPEKTLSTDEFYLETESTIAKIHSYSTVAISSSTSSAFVLILDMVCSSMRNVREPLSKILALDVFLQLLPYLPDDVRLEKMLPYIVELLSDAQSLVKVTALRTLTRVLEKIKRFPPSDAQLFSEYLLPALGIGEDESASSSVSARGRGKQTAQRERSGTRAKPATLAAAFHTDKEEFVRQAFAENVAKLAQIAARFLEASQYYRNLPIASSSVPQPNSTSPQSSASFSSDPYDKELRELQDTFHTIVEHILMRDTSSMVKRALLADFPLLCRFFGESRIDTLLSYLSTFLSGGDWELRCAYFTAVRHVSEFVGNERLEQFIIPLIFPALTDEEEAVIHRAISFLISLCERNLMRKKWLLEVVDKALSLLLHPNLWIRNGTIGLVVAVAKRMSFASLHCFLLPKLKHFLQTDSIVTLDEQSLLQALLPPLGRRSFDNSVILLRALITLPNFDDLYEPKLKENGFSDEDTSKLTLMKEYMKAHAIRLRTGAMIAEQIEKEKDERARQGPTASHPPCRFGENCYRKNVEHLRRYWHPPTQREAASTGFYGKLIGVPVHSIAVASAPPSFGMSNGITAVEGGANVERVVMVSTESAVVDMRGENRAKSSHRFSRMAGRVRSAASEKLGSGEFKGGDPRRTTRFPSAVGVSPSPAAAPPPPSPRISLDDLLPPSAERLLPPPLPDLGSLVRVLDGSPFREWKPRGILVAHLNEHTGAVNEIEAAKDNVFFASCSDDGTVKVWDCKRLLKNPTNKSHVTYSSQGGKIRCLCICENSHSVASGSDNGSVHVFTIEYVSSSTLSALSSSLKKRKNNKRDADGNVNSDGNYVGGASDESDRDGLGSGSGESMLVKKGLTGGTSVKYFDKAEGPVIGIKHFNSDSQSVLVYATSAGFLHGWDLRAKQEAWLLSNRPELGLVTSFMVEGNRNWMVVATARGFFTVWDLRFKIPIKTWRHPEKKIIHSVRHCNRIKQSCVYCASEGNEVDVWDTETGRRLEVFRVVEDVKKEEVGQVNGEEPKDKFSPQYNSKAVDGDSELEARKWVFRRRSSSSVPARDQNLIRNLDFGVSDLGDLEALQAYSNQLWEGRLEAEPKARPPASKNSVRITHSRSGCPWVITAGTDKKIRMWDLRNVSNSGVIVGWEEDRPKPEYSVKTGGVNGLEDLIVYTETPVRSQLAGTSRANTAATNSTATMNSSSVNHFDTILALETLDRPQPLLVSGDRAGVIKVWK